jgi:hypothetical protein
MKIISETKSVKPKRIVKPAVKVAFLKICSWYKNSG